MKVKLYTIKKIKYVILIILLSGCASSPNQQSMTINSMDIVKSNPELMGQVNVRSVTGGKETNPLWMSKVDNQALKGALEQSLSSVGYKAQDPNDASYQVDVNLNSLNQPMIGLTFNVTSNMTYSVNENGNTATFPINAVGSARTSDAFIGVERMKIANARSIKESIKQFINQISEYYK
jgi:hypothetical protein